MENASVAAVAPSRTKTLSFVLATLLVALPAMILTYLWATGG